MIFHPKLYTRGSLAKPIINLEIYLLLASKMSAYEKENTARVENPYRHAKDPLSNIPATKIPTRVQITFTSLH